MNKRKDEIKEIIEYFKNREIIKLVERKESPLMGSLLHESPIYADISELRNRKIYANTIAYINKHVFTTREELDRIASLADEEYTKFAFEKALRFAEKLKEFSGKLKEMHYSKDITEKFVKLFALLDCFLIFPLSIEKKLEKEVVEEMKRKGITLDKLVLLLSPEKSSSSLDERKELLNIAVKLKNIETSEEINEELESHARKYSWLGIGGGGGREWTKEEIAERIKNIKRPEVEIERLKNNKEKLKKEKEELLNRFNEKEREKIKKASEWVWLRTYRIDTLVYAYAQFLRFLEKEKTKNAKYYTIDEILNEDFHKIDLEERKTFASILLDGRYHFFEREEAERLKEFLLKEAIEKKETIEGDVANPGKARGIVKIIKSIEDIKKMNKGDILVSPMTEPKFVPAMEKAAAFVTDEGGILCHAAIVSREMGKPCIIGTKVATKVLKDGDEVEVDADKGIVKIIKQR